jgi:membrane fusion protein (multidrug efflux system)
MKVSRVQTLILLLISLSLSACNAHRQKPDDKTSKITVTAVQSKPVTLTQRYVCQIRSHHHIEVRAPQTGYLEAIAIKEGQAVKEGDLMFQINPILNQKKADAESAEAKSAELEYNYTKKQYEDKVVSQHELLLRDAKLTKARAKADLAKARLSFATVKAPFNGMVGRLLDQQGSLVQTGETLTTLSDNSLIWVYFKVPESRYLEYKSANLDQHKDDLKIELVLANGNKFDQPGKLGAIGADFDSATGSVSFRADFPNPDRLLRHGEIGTVLISQAEDDAIVVPQRATFEVRQKRYVYVVDKDGVAHQREIVIENELDDLFVVNTGVSVGDKIVLEGFRLVRDGGKVEYKDRQSKKVVKN